MKVWRMQVRALSDYKKPHQSRDAWRRCIPSAENRDASVVCARKQVCHKALWEGYDMTAHQVVSSGQHPPPQLTWLPRVGVYLRVGHNKD